MALLKTVSANQQWRLVRTVVFNDADLALAAVTATITLEPLSVGSTNLIQEEVIVHERITFAGNAGTLLLDIGKNGSTEIYAKDVALKAATGTNTLGSSTTSVKPRIIEANGLPVVLTFTSSSGNLSTLSAGAVDIWMRYGPTPNLQ